LRPPEYPADAYRQVLAAAGIAPSMSRTGNCLDNAPMAVRPLSRTGGVRGLTYHTLKVERVHHRVYPTRDDARRELFGYIEGFYNSRRLHSAIGYRSPVDMERIAAKPRPLSRGRISSDTRSQSFTQALKGE
jgi:transposase InsO family protein